MSDQLFAKAKQWLAFMASGVPSFLLAIPLNYVLVEKALISKPVAYGIVLAFQITVNFFLCRWLVFKRTTVKRLWHDFAVFFIGIAMFRAVDWMLYVFLIYRVDVYYLVAQLCSTILMSFMKYWFSARLFRGERESH